MPATICQGINQEPYGLPRKQAVEKRLPYQSGGDIDAVHAVKIFLYNYLRIPAVPPGRAIALSVKKVSSQLSARTFSASVNVSTAEESYSCAVLSDFF